MVHTKLIGEVAKSGWLSILIWHVQLVKELHISHDAHLPNTWVHLARQEDVPALLYMLSQKAKSESANCSVALLYLL